MPEPFLRVPICPGPATTRSPTWYEAQWAELLILEFFKRDFERRFPPPTLVIGQLDYLSRLTGIRAIDQLLGRMASDFKNELSRVQLRRDISTDRPGRNLKPDVLGIAVTPQGIVMELVEVTTVKQAQATLRDDVEHKLRVLREKVLTTDTRLLDSDYFQRSGTTKFIVSPSKWRPSWDQMFFPLLPRAVGNRGQQIEWICYEPTFRFAPPRGIDGLVLYEVHSLGIPEAVPKEVLDRLAQELRRKRQLQLQAARPLTLTPWISDDYWARNAKDKELMLYLAVGSLIGLAVMLAVVAGPILLAGGAVGAADASAVAGGAVVIESAEAAAVLSVAAATHAETMGIVSQIMQSIGRPLASQFVFGL